MNYDAAGRAPPPQGAKPSCSSLGALPEQGGRGLWVGKVTLEHLTAACAAGAPEPEDHSVLQLLGWRRGWGRSAITGKPGAETAGGGGRPAARTCAACPQAPSSVCEPA